MKVGSRLSHDWRVVRAGGAGHKLLMVRLCLIVVLDYMT